MPVTIDQPVPYAPASAILELIDRHRNKGLPTIVDADVLSRAGISDSLVPRTLQALKTLDLLTEDGRPSEVFEDIRLAPTAEYQQRLTKWLSSAYADTLSYVDPATDDEVAIRDAFRKYTPTGQQPRMVSLFIGLFTAAGVIPSKQRQTTARASASGSAKSPRLRSVGHAKSRSGADARPRSYLGATPAHNPSRQHTASHGLPSALGGLLATLPPEGQGWTKEQRDKFMTAFPVILDYSYPIITAPEPVDECEAYPSDNGDQSDD